MNISTAFAPPFKLVSPFFIIGILSLVFCVFSLFTADIQSLYYLNSGVLAWVHIFLLAFVMMIILGALAQLIPVVLEVGHFAVDLYYVVYPLLLIGTVLMALGFYFYPLLLPFGGVFVFIAFFIFLIEAFLTINKVKEVNFITSTIIVSNIFLFVGLIIGIFLALNHGGIISFDTMKFLKAHVFLLFFGFVAITIMSMSLILLPMFWLSHSFSWIYVKSAFYILCLSIILMVFNVIFTFDFLEYSSYFLALIALVLYFVQIFVIYNTRVRLEKDIYFKSIVFAYCCLALSLILAIIYAFIPALNLGLTIAWLIFAGYITFIITGHLYKIIPFLVWYERFSIYVGKEKVPMLVDLIPKKSANFQFIASSSGVFVTALGFLFTNSSIYYMGLSFLSVGVIFLLKDVWYMINIKKETYVF